MREPVVHVNFEIDAVDDVFHPADVVGMRMRGNDEVEVGYAFRFQYIAHLCCRFAGIDEHAFTCRLYEERIGLPDVEHRHAQLLAKAISR